MASVASQLTEEVTAHAQSDSVEDAQEICTDGTYFLNNLRIYCALFVQIKTIYKMHGTYTIIALMSSTDILAIH